METKPGGAPVSIMLLSELAVDLAKVNTDCNGRWQCKNQISSFYAQPMEPKIGEKNRFEGQWWNDGDVMELVVRGKSALKLIPGVGGSQLVRSQAWM